MKPEILEQLSWRDCAEIADTFFDFIHDVSCGRASGQKTKEELYTEVLNRLKEKAK